MKNRHTKTLTQKYGIGYCDNDKFLNSKEDAETLFDWYDYLGYLYIPKTINDIIGGYLSEADDKDCIQNHLSEYYKTKVVKVTEKITEIVFINYHLNSLCFGTIENTKYAVKGNVLVEVETTHNRVYQVRKLKFPLPNPTSRTSDKLKRYAKVLLNQIGVTRLWITIN